jgi:hypothetical protein
MEANFANWQRRRLAPTVTRPARSARGDGDDLSNAYVKKPRKNGKLVMTCDDMIFLYDQIKHDKTLLYHHKSSDDYVFIKCDDISRLAILII